MPGYPASFIRASLTESDAGISPSLGEEGFEHYKREIPLRGELLGVFRPGTKPFLLRAFCSVGQES